MLSPLGEGTRRAALRWLAHLRVADTARARALFTHHPRYADLTPAQYAEALAWLRGMGLVTLADRPLVDISWSGLRDESANFVVPRVLWNNAAEEVHAQIGAAGEQIVLNLLKRGGAEQVRHVALVSDAYGYDIEAVMPVSGRLRLEVKSTTDPTRLVVHLTRHEHGVMLADPEWEMVAVLVGADGGGLSVATVCRQWLSSAVPQDRTRNGRWESARLTVPPHALTPGLDIGRDRLFLEPGSFSADLAWGMRSDADLPA